jgi:hypothetical protein
MSISAAFLWRFLDDVWDLLPTKERELFEAYWSGLVQVSGNFQQKAIEAALSTEVSSVPVFLTERWNRYSMEEGNIDVLEASDTLLLVGTAPETTSKEASFYETLVLTSTTGQISYEETMQFFDQAVRGLRYGKLVKGTISVTLGGFEFTQNRDYVVNVEGGTIQALETGRIPVDDVVNIRYMHDEYTRGSDYEIDELNSQVYRIATGKIASGTTVVAKYSYNATATLPMSGTSASAIGSILTDPEQDFSTLLPNRTLTISTGPNVGAYTVQGVLSRNELQIAESFPTDQATDTVYSINAFPYGVKISSNIVSVPFLQDRIDDAVTFLVEGVDYVVQSGILSSRIGFPLSGLGSEDTRIRQMWAEVSRINDETPYRNFGVLIDFYRENSEEYKQALQGLWYTFWTGSTPGNLERGLHILLGLPYARKAGTVTRVDTDLGQIDITDPRGQIITYTIPSGLDPEVSVGDEAFRFQQLTTGVEIIDRNNQPGFVTSELGRGGIDQYLTDNATRGAGNTDETKALDLLEHHLFLPRILAESVNQRINVTELVTFLDNMRPQWTNYVFSFLSDGEENLTITEEEFAIDPAIDLTTTVSNNEWNQSFLYGSFIVDGADAFVPFGGTQLTGNFRDVSEDFVAAGVQPGDIVQIKNGTFKGYHAVLAVINSTTLSLDISDSMIIAEANIEYVLVSQYSGRLDHDSFRLGRENIVLNGTEYTAPATLNTKTDILLGGTSLSDSEVKALLLVDIGISGDEVQAITDSDVTEQEFSVGSPPGVVVRDHQIASVAVKRTNNVGAIVTDAFAI